MHCCQFYSPISVCSYLQEVSRHFPAMQLFLPLCSLAALHRRPFVQGSAALASSLFMTSANADPALLPKTGGSMVLCALPTITPSHLAPPLASR